MFDSVLDKFLYMKVAGKLCVITERTLVRAPVEPILPDLQTLRCWASAGFHPWYENKYQVKPGLTNRIFDGEGCARRLSMVV